MCMLMGLLEGFFIPLYSYHITPVTEEQKIHNVALAFELMDNAGLPKPKARAEGRQFKEWYSAPSVSHCSLSHEIP